MRIPRRVQAYLGSTAVAKVELNSECRSRMIPILRGIQEVYSQHNVRKQALALIAADIGSDVDLDRGRPGMTLWQVFVLASVRLGCNLTYDELQDLAENHTSLRQIMEVVDHWKDESFDFRRIRDNICRVRPETIEKINHLVVAVGHSIEPSAAESVRGDSFVAETNIHYPTESSLILDGLRKILSVAPQLAKLVGASGWRQRKSLLRKAKKAARAIARATKGDKGDVRLKDAYQKLFHVAEMILPRAQDLLDLSLESGMTGSGLDAGEASYLLGELTYWHATTSHVCGTAHRRVMEGEQVPNSDKLFSLFEPDTELIRRGKARQPIQYGHKVLVIEDAVGFICHYKVIPLATDERDVLIPEMKSVQERLEGRINSASFDRGFHSPSNQEQLAGMIKNPCLPKPGSKQAAEQEAQASVQFREARKHHPGIESAIGAMQSGNGLVACRDHTPDGYARYIGLGVLGRNLLVLGKLLLSQEHPSCLAAASLRDAA